MNAVWRKPWIVSKKLSWAPGCGRSLRTITREPSGQRRRSISFDTSATKAPVAARAVLLDRRAPAGGMERDDRLAHLGGDREAEAEGDAQLPTGPGEAVGRPGRVGPNDIGGRALLARAGTGVLGQGVDRPAQHDLVVGRRVRAGVTRPKDGRQRLAGGDLGTVEEAGERVEAVGALPGRGRQLLVRVRRTIVASMSRQSSELRSGSAPAAQARLSAVARPRRRPERCAPLTRSSTRQTVGLEATGPNRRGWSRSTRTSLIESAPSAMATERSASTLPG